jgi:hypothetical protein
MKVSISARVSASAHASGSDDNNSSSKTTGEGSSFDISTTTNSKQIPPTIHGEIVFSGDTDKMMPIGVRASAFWNGDNFPSVNVSRSEIGYAEGSVYPASLPAVSGATAVPTSGVYLVDSKVEPYKWGYAKCFAETFDASVLA